jgi:pyruvate dehydrogenase E2 component (dihydrolipoamide acetyltransferase)
MSELREFRLPDVGEGLTEAEIVKWHVQPGDSVKINQIIVEIETAKAVVELPSPYAGRVADLLVPEGSSADVGTPIISVEVGTGAAPGKGETGGEAAQRPAATTAAPESAAVAAGTAAAGTAAAGTAAAGTAAATTANAEPEQAAESAAGRGEKRQAVLVGYGVKAGSATRRSRKPVTPRGGQPGPAGRAGTRPAGVTASDPASQAASPGTRPNARDSAGRAAPPGGTSAQQSGGAAQPGGASAQPGGGSTAPASERPVLAKPPVRKLAKDLGVDLSSLSGTGPDGSITRDDVRAATEQASTAGLAAVPPALPTGQRPVSAVPREERIKVHGVRKHIAAAMTASAFTAPHVTEFLQVDMTESISATVRLRELPEFSDVRVSPLLLVAKALLVTIGRHPMINSTWDEPAQEIVVRHYVNLGIAAATDRGLIVPSIKDAHALSLPELAVALARLAETARAGKATPADLTGGTITITNVGVFGVDYGTPILTPGEAAILALGQIKKAPWVHGGQLAVRDVCTLALSFDHRIVDGELGSAVLRDVGAMLADPLRMLAWS